MTSEDWLRALLAHFGEERRKEAEWKHLFGQAEGAFQGDGHLSHNDFSHPPLPCTCCPIHRPLNDHV